MDVDAIAHKMFIAVRSREQDVRRIPDDADAAEVRARVRALARDAGVRIRTARLGDTVVVVLLDAAVWRQDTATMRAKLTLPDR